MTSETDITQPGKAGLYFCTDRLTDAGWQQEREARAKLEKWCAFCGQIARFGYGGSLHEVGVWACGDADCRQSAEAEVDRRKAAKTLGRAA